MSSIDAVQRAFAETAREVARRRMVEAFSDPSEEARRALGARFLARMERRREAMGPALWAQLEAGLEGAMATGDCAALTEAVDAIETAQQREREREAEATLNAEP